MLYFLSSLALPSFNCGKFVFQFISPIFFFCIGNFTYNFSILSLIVQFSIWHIPAKDPL